MNLLAFVDGGIPFFLISMMALMFFNFFEKVPPCI